MGEFQIDISFSLKDKVALITGGARGIGKAIAVLFAQNGARTVLVDLDPAVESVAQEISALGIKSIAVVADVTKKDDVERTVAVAVKEFGTIDILVNNAGVAYLDDAENLSEEYWDKTMAVNLKAPFLLAQAVGKVMIQQKKGKIINISSQAGIIALDKHVAYCASKAGLIGMTKVLALEWAEFGINVNAIAPTVILTELGKKAWAGEVGEAMKKKIPLRRFGYPEEVAAAALYLASPASDLVTGETLVIDGGYTIQ
ncbi:MAG: D-threitol dehydrogenase [Candidatus Atribacteria bacterium]|nr:D-threitol dehydrogenase [Candidatus Atribacteria bacterium]